MFDICHYLLQEQLKKRLNARIQYAKFLQDTVGEMAKELKTSRSGELRRTADDLDEFMQKVGFNLFLKFFLQPLFGWQLYL
jgi:hypothetical protein